MVYELLDDLIGAKYESCGRGPAYDCYGLVLEVARRYGIKFPDVILNLTPEENHKYIVANKGLFAKLKDKSDFCIVLLSPRMKFSNHMGFVLNYPYFIHAKAKSGVWISNLDSLFWNPRIRGFYR